MADLIQIRQVPEQSRRMLKSRAAARGVSLNAYLLALIEREVSRPTTAEVLARAAARAETADGSAAEALAAARSERAGGPTRSPS